MPRLFYALLSVLNCVSDSAREKCVLQPQLRRFNEKKLNVKEGIRLLLVFLPTTLKHLEVQSSNHKNHAPLPILTFDIVTVVVV